MNRKDMLELKRRFKKDECTFTKLCGCYVNGDKKKLLEFRETFLNLPDEDYYKYLEISKKVLSGTVGNNLLELNFNADSSEEESTQTSLLALKKSALKNDAMLSAFYDSIIESYDHAGNFLILLFHDAYDVITRTSDNLKLDESEEVYEYILCAICPVSLSKPGLGYYDDEHKIKARIRDWVVETPANGFLYPGFIDRSSDVNTVIYYTKNAKEPHPELMEKGLGCSIKTTATLQKESFQSIIKSTVSPDDEVSSKVYLDIQENLSAMVEEYNDLYEDTTVAPLPLSTEKVRSLLVESGVPEESVEKIEASFKETFEDDEPIAENLVDTKLLRANAHKKKEAQLQEQVEQLESKLEVMQSRIPADEDDDGNESAMDTELSDDQDKDDYDVVLHVNPNKLPTVKTEMINGRRCLVIPMEDNEKFTINGKDDLI